MRHPSKVGAFCSRKIAHGASDKILGGGPGPLPCGKHLKRGPKMPAGIRRPWFMRIQDAKRAIARLFSAVSSPKEQA